MSKKNRSRGPRRDEYTPTGMVFRNEILPAKATVFRGRKGTDLGLNHTITQTMFQKELDAYQRELAKQEAPKLPANPQQ